MNVPSIGDVLQDAQGQRYLVVGVALRAGVDDERPHVMALYIDLEPLGRRPPVPDAFREGADVG